jgi:epoxyqueuosine reductase
VVEDFDQVSFHDRVSKLAQAAGFDLAGIVPLQDQPENDAYLEAWIAAGHAGEMEYLKRRNDDQQLLRSSVQTAFPWARSIVVCAANYNADAPKSTDPAPEGAGWIARYAWSGELDENGATKKPTDYHDVLLTRLRKLESELQGWLGFEQSRSYIDTGPVIERAYARLAGIGWTGKNTCIINQQLGSWLFLGVIVLSYEVPEQQPLATLPPDRCGTCRRCIEACPTDALIAPYEMDASRCIAYLTIEKRGTVPEQLRPLMGRQVFGCDICQDVCPWNRRALIAADPQLAARPELVNPQLVRLAELDPRSFNQLFKQTPVKRTKISGLRRNVAIAMGNSGCIDYLPKLKDWSQSADPVLGETATWAIRQIED